MNDYSNSGRSEISELPQGFQGAREHGHKIMGGKGTKRKLSNPKTSGTLSTSVQRFDFWDRLGN